MRETAEIYIQKFCMKPHGKNTANRYQYDKKCDLDHISRHSLAPPLAPSLYLSPRRSSVLVSIFEMNELMAETKS